MFKMFWLFLGNIGKLFIPSSGHTDCPDWTRVNAFIKAATYLPIVLIPYALDVPNLSTIEAVAIR